MNHNPNPPNLSLIPTVFDMPAFEVQINVPKIGLSIHYRYRNANRILFLYMDDQRSCDVTANEVTDDCAVETQDQ